jgi:hypothetical protein
MVKTESFTERQQGLLQLIHEIRNPNRIPTGAAASKFANAGAKPQFLPEDAVAQLDGWLDMAIYEVELHHSLEIQKPVRFLWVADCEAERLQPLH